MKNVTKSTPKGKSTQILTIAKAGDTAKSVKADHAKIKADKAVIAKAEKAIVKADKLQKIEDAKLFKSAPAFSTFSKFIKTNVVKNRDGVKVTEAIHKGASVDGVAEVFTLTYEGGKKSNMKNTMLNRFLSV